MSSEEPVRRGGAEDRARRGAGERRERRDDRDQLLALQVGRPAVGGVLEHIERLLAHRRARIAAHGRGGGWIVEADAGPVRVDHDDAGRLRGGRCRSGEQGEDCSGESTGHDAPPFRRA